MIKRGPHDSLVFECDACQRPVLGEDGYVHIDMASVTAAQEAAAQWERQQPGTYSVQELSRYPEPVAWQVHHMGCDPRPDDGNYWFHVGRIDSWPKLVGWTGHLMEKPWLSHTTWGAVLQDIGEST